MSKRRATHAKQIMPVLKNLRWLLLGLALGACTPQAPTKGTLEVLVVAPSGVSLSPNLRVEGPDGPLTVTTLGKSTFPNLTPGEYTLEALEVTAEDGYSYRANPTKVQLEAGATVLANVNYQVFSGKLSLNVTVNPPVAGFTPNVEVRNASNAVVATLNTTGPRTLNLPPGAYTVLAGPPPTNYRVNQPSQSVVVTAGHERTVNVAFGLGFGTIAVTVNAPSGVSGFTPSVTVTGPGGATSITTPGPTTLSNQVVGTYTVSASNVGPLNGVTYQPTITVAPAGANPFTLNNDATQNVTVNYTPAGASVAVTLQGLAASDTLTLTLRSGSASGPVVGTRTVTPSTPQPIRFDNLPFASIHASASGVRRGTYLDAFLVSDAPSVTPSLSSPSASMTVNVSVRPRTGELFVGGNGSLDNTGLTVNGASIPDSRRGDDVALTMSDSSLPASTTGEVITALAGLSPRAGLYRLELDASGNLYAIYQFVAGQSFNRVVRISRANLEAGNLSEASNRRIVGAALGERTFGAETRNNVTDLAFDAEGNLWIANQASEAIACISAARIASGTAEVNQPNRVLVGASGDLRSPRALAFDRQGNLWIAGGRNAFQLGLSAYLVRIPRTGPNLDCPNTLSSAEETAPIDVRLNLNLPSHPGGPFYQPSALALSPDGSALWVADLGGGSDYYNTDSSCISNGSIDINTVRESVVKVPLIGSNLMPSSSYNAIQIALRITIGNYNRDPVPSGQTPPDRGLQQAAGLAFDSRGNLWIAANNNIEVDPDNPCYASAGFVTGTLEQRNQYCSDPAAAPIDCPGPLSRLLTDRRGKVYVVDAEDLRDSTGLSVVTPRLTLSGPPPGDLVGGVRPAYGFTGLALNIPPLAP